MMTKMLSTGLVAAAAILAMAPVAASAQALTTAEQAQADALSRDIVVVANRVPANSPVSTYEAQFAALLSNTNYSCSILRASFTRLRGIPVAATRALRRLDDTLTTCGGAGTGAIGGGGPTATAGVPGFAVGGGADYVR